jgi:kelch-like protein 18
MYYITLGADCADFRDQDLLTDVTLVIGSDEFRAHKLLLATTIPYFNRMFCSGMIETSKEVIPIFLETDPSIQPNSHSFKAIIDFVYSGKIILHVDTVQV